MVRTFCFCFWKDKAASTSTSTRSEYVYVYGGIFMNIRIAFGVVLNEQA